MSRNIYIRQIKDQKPKIDSSGSAISATFVEVQEKLQFVIIPIDVTVEVGDAARFVCQGKGDPSPAWLSWSYNGGNPPASVSLIVIAL